ncbi:MAG: 2-C-methyl-D-erythritol 4-phosphate cytidylyltransferase [Chlamydiae bacterium]|nr:2-C-methyl-D-erythritol 4-phosphate cytidylyltransferase [Chlamydiota bacterium]
MYQDKTVKAIILMAGQGIRFGANSPKQFHKLGGKAVYLHSLQAMQDHEWIDEVVLVTPFEWMQEVSKEVSVFTQKPIHVVRGAKDRQGSSWQGILALGPDTDIVLIHDGVRPFVSQEILQKNIEKAAIHQAVNTCIPTYDTLAIIDDQRFVKEIPDRSKFLRGQTPQTFSYDLIVKAHLEAQRKNEVVTDDCSLVLAIGAHPYVVEGSDDNIKITTELDLFLAEQLLYMKKKEVMIFSDRLDSLKGKVFIVVGASGDIGKAICSELSNRKAQAISVSRSSSTWPCDVTNSEEVKATFSKIKETYGSVDGVINSMGHLQVADLHVLEDEMIEKQVNVNLTSAILICKHAAVKEKGHIINIASSSYSRGRKSYTVYSAAKSGLVNFTLGFAEERTDLCINAVVPQRTKTKMRLANFPLESEDALLTPQEVALEVVKILSIEHITGEIIPITKKPVHPRSETIR